MKKIFLLSLMLLLLMSCKEENQKTIVTKEATVSPVKRTVKNLKDSLTAKGYKTFEYIDEATQDTILMQQYYMAFLKRGKNRSQSKEQTDSLQKLHMEHLGKMYEMGYADISGPFGDDGDIRGITIYNVPTFEMADSLASEDPMVKSGRLEIEIHPWWAAKGFPLR